MLDCFVSFTAYSDGPCIRLYGLSWFPGLIYATCIICERKKRPLFLLAKPSWVEAHALCSDEQLSFVDCLAHRDEFLYVVYIHIHVR